jgi:hypothetical protein
MAARKPIAEVPRRTPAKGPKSANPTAKGGSNVSVSPGKGGVNIGTATRCTSKRAAGNVRTY